MQKIKNSKLATGRHRNYSKNQGIKCNIYRQRMYYNAEINISELEILINQLKQENYL